MPRASSEERPLLGAEPGENGDVGAGADGHTRRYQRRVIAIMFAIVILVDLAAFFMEAPLTSILETNICSRYYNKKGPVGAMSSANFSGGVEDGAGGDCNVRAVQTELATVSQLLNTFNRLPGFIAAIPFGMIADRYGRRPVLLLAVLGSLIQDILSKVILWHPGLFPSRLVWLSSAALLVGGGDAVAGSMMFLIVADVALPRERAGLFFLLTACGLVAEVVATPLSALLMSKDPWIPYLLYSVLTLLSGTVALLFLPETLPRGPRAEPETPRHAECGGTTAGPEELPGAALTSAHQPSLSSTAALSTALGAVVGRFQRLLRPNVVALLLAFFVSALGRQSTSFLLQYIRHRFNWSYEKASLLITGRAVVNLGLLLVGLPAINKVLVHRGMSAPRKDLLIARYSVLFSAAGSLLIAVAPVAAVMVPGIAIFALGSGFAPAARSLVTSFSYADETGVLYSALAIMQSVGGLVAGPLLALCFRWGLSLGHQWTGIPFIAVAGLFACGFLAVSFVGLSKLPARS